MAPELYAVNERVLCYHGPMIYEAKIIKTEIWDENNTQTADVGAHYFVHYKGWKATWDEWVPQVRLLKWNDVNLQKQKQIHAELQATEKKRGTSSHQAAKDGSGSRALHGSGGAAGAGAGVSRHNRGADSKKRKRDDDDTKKPELKLVIPDVLKVVLVDDWENVTRHHTLVPLPRTPSVQDVLKQFQQHILDMPESQQLPLAPAIISTIISGLQTYFDRALGSILLYRFERAQYADMRKQFITGQHVKTAEGRTMSSIYGAEHLARLLVKLPEMVAHTTMDDASVVLLRDYSTELMNWMARRKEQLFVSEYEAPAPHYTNLART